MSQSLVPPRFLFRFITPIRHTHIHWTDTGQELGTEHRLLPLGELDGERQFADVRAAWNPSGLVFNVRVDQKRHLLWCHDTRLDESDGLQLWIDTRNTQNIHRATRFCHRFAFLPVGGGRNFDQPIADQLLINRARENARPVRPRELQISCRVHPSGYALAAFVPAIALDGYNPEEYHEIGFHYVVLDRELGIQSFAVSSVMPYDEDPSLWATLEMVQ